MCICGHHYELLLSSHPYRGNFICVFVASGSTLEEYEVFQEPYEQFLQCLQRNEMGTRFI
jgi:uncharacterized Fe-S cluster-containing MiaB family protein